MKAEVLQIRVSEIVDMYYELINNLPRKNTDLQRTLMAIRDLPGTPTLQIIYDRHAGEIAKKRMRRLKKYDGLVNQVTATVKRENQYLILDALVGALKQEVPGFDFDLFLVFPDPVVRPHTSISEGPESLTPRIQLELTADDIKMMQADHRIINPH
jgi:hypothetical protein